MEYSKSDFNWRKIQILENKSDARSLYSQVFFLKKSFSLINKKLGKNHPKSEQKL